MVIENTKLVLAAFCFLFTFIVIIIPSIKIVPQGYKHLVQRLGKFHKILEPGFNVIIPYVDLVSHKVTTKDIVLNIPSQEVITRDNVVITTNAVAYIKIIHPAKAIYGVEYYDYAIENLVQTSLRSIVGEMSLDDALSSREHIKSKLKNAISDDIAEWGIVLKTVEIQDISPSETMQRAMEEQAAAERQRRATVTQAEGQKTAAILEADGRLEASKRDAEAKVVLAEANQNAIKKLASVIGKEYSPAMYLISEKYVEALKSVSSSKNTKVIMLPAEISTSIQAILAKTDLST